MGVKDWKAPWHLHKYAQMDYILINNEWKNAITNVSTTYVHTVETDHKLMMANVKFKLKAHNTTKPPNIPQFRTPSPQELTTLMTRLDILRAPKTYSTALKLLLWNN